MINSQTITRSNLNLHSGRIENYKRDAYGISGNTENAFFRIFVIQEGIFKIHLSRTEEFDEHSYAVISKPVGIDFSIIDVNGHIEVRTESLILEIKKDPFTVLFKDVTGNIINEDDPGLGTSWIGEQVTTYKKLQEGERFIGLGEKTGPLDRKGNGYENWNTDHFGYPPDSDPLYCTTPFYIGIHSGTAYGLYLDNSHKTHFNFGASNRRFSSFSADQGDMAYYFIYEPSIEEIISSYTNLTGRMELPPI